MTSLLVALADGSQAGHEEGGGWLAILIYARYIVPAALVALGIGAWIYGARKGARARRAAIAANEPKPDRDRHR